jgi:RNase H-fold protein (predicted Holliday junction resolvase)
VTDSETPETVLSIDPGSVKCGLAVVTGPEIRRLHLGVVETERLVVEVAEARRRFPQITRLLIGSGTRSATLRRALQAAFSDLPLQIIDEHGSSQRARQRFVAEIPGPGWRRFLPAGLRVPERPYDDFVALLLAEDYFLQNAGTKPPNA